MDTVDDLIRDFITRLSDVVEDFRSRADRLVISSPLSGSPAARPPVKLVECARQQMAARKARRSFFPTEIFYDPAWDMLTALFIAYNTEPRMNVTTLISFSDASLTSCQRWIENLHQYGLVVRFLDNTDRRRVDIALSQRGYQAMVGYLEEVCGLSRDKASGPGGI